MNQGLSTNYCLKSHIERIFGNKLFLTVKDYPSLHTWKKTLFLMIKCYKKSIEQSIKIAPEQFYDENNKIYEHYNQLIKKGLNEEELFSTMVAFQSEIIFSLLGNITNYENRTLKSSWDLSAFRETQIVQSKTQFHNEIKNLVYKRFTLIEIDEMANEKRGLHNKDDFYLWIYKNKIDSKK